MGKGWIAVDLDGTLAKYDGWKGVEHIGEPVPLMRERVLRWLAQGKDVRIFTARVAGPDSHLAKEIIQAWCEKHLGQSLPVTNVKDMRMVELWDDRAVSILSNHGVRLDGRSDES